MEPETNSMNTKELTQAVSLLLEQEETRATAERRRTRRRRRRRREEMEAGIAKLSQSIEVIKRCIVGITTILFVSLIIMILVVMEVEREAERIKGEVEGIQLEAKLIRDKIRHPLQTIGGRIGGQLDATVRERFGGSESVE